MPRNTIDPYNSFIIIPRQDIQKEAVGDFSLGETKTFFLKNKSFEQSYCLLKKHGMMIRTENETDAPSGSLSVCSFGWLSKSRKKCLSFSTN